MAIIENYFEQVQLSLAAYALDLQTGMSGSNQTTVYIDKLVFAGMSQIQAETFANSYTVVDQFTDPGTSGFSGTVFKRGNEYFFALRGTEGLFSQDIVEDIANLAGDGAAWRQIIEMYNYYQRLTASAGADVTQYRRNVIFDESQGIPEYETYTAVGGGLGFLSSSEQLTVAGHSLGGHLAVAFGNLFPDIVSSVSVYNGLGIERNLFTEELFATLGGGFVPGIIDTRVTHLIGEAGLEIISNFIPVPGDNQLIFIEDQLTVADPPSALNHSIRALSDSLAVYDLLGTLDPNLTLNQIKPILESGSNTSEQSLESVVNALGDLFGVGTTVTTDLRDELYTRIQAIQGVLPLYPGIALTGLQDDAPQALAVAARSADKGFLYALENLNPSD